MLSATAKRLEQARAFEGLQTNNMELGATSPTTASERHLTHSILIVTNHSIRGGEEGAQLTSQVSVPALYASSSSLMPSHFTRDPDSMAGQRNRNAKETE